MKKIINRCLLSAMCLSVFYTNAFAYDLTFTENIKDTSDVVFLTEKGLPIQTYIGEGVINIINDTPFSVYGVELIDNAWSVSTEIPLAYGGTSGFSIASLFDTGVYYIVTQENNIKKSSVLYIKGDTNYTSNAFCANLVDYSININGVLDSADVFEINNKLFLEINDIARLLSNTNKSFSLDFNDEFEIINIDPNGVYSENIVEKNYTSKMLALTNVTDLFKQLHSTNVEGYSIGGNNFYDISKLAQNLDFDINIDNNSIAINTK